METDIGNPIDYIPHKEEEKHEDDSSPIDEEQYYYQQPPQQYFQPPTYQMPMEKTDFFSSVDKSVWIIAFAVFLLGFFMGKTMQPVILRYA
jgi:5-deoxy-D-glucuronate isomerase